MAYRVYLVDTNGSGDWVELDVENVDFTTIFSITDVNDISSRKDKVTKQIDFKGTKVNNEAFGSWFHMNKVSDFNLNNRLFFNYNPLRAVECLIYEDSMLLLRGSLRLNKTVINNGFITYQTNVTGSLIDFKFIVNERQLEELDFTDLKHRYNWDKILNSWNVRTERFNTTSNTFEFKPFTKGSGYVYPFIDYGIGFLDTTESVDVAKINILNFRPAIYVKEYFNRIFNQDELNGYTYEIKGSTELVDKFDSLIIPSNVEKVVGKANDMKCEATSLFSTTQSFSKNSYNDGSHSVTRAIPTHQIVSTNGANTFDWFGQIKSEEGTSYIVNRAFTSNGYCKVKINSLFNGYDAPSIVNIQLCEREFVSAGDGSFSDPGSWNVVTSKTINLPAKGGITPGTIVELEVGEREFKLNSLLCLRIVVENVLLSEFFESFFGTRTIYNLSDVVIRFPKDDNALTTYEVKEGDVITPEPIKGIKQIDFIKSVINLFNFYVYSTNDRPKHLIFQQYSDYYALSQVQNLVTNAIDWTKKIDYSIALEVESNLKIPKNYLFTFKEDGDFINSNYKKNYNEVFGTKRFSDAYGVTEEKKVEVIFSPSPLVQYLGTGRIHPAIYAIDGQNKKPTKSNIRIMYYNGLKNCQAYQVGRDIIEGNVQDVEFITTVNNYPQVGNYYLEPGLTNMTPKSDLNFGLAKEMSFDFKDIHQTVPTAYQQYYINQVTDLTNPNVVYVEGEAFLNEIDIANLDLRVPVFIDMGADGHSYWRVLSVEYKSNQSTSSIKLQKIVI